MRNHHPWIPQIAHAVVAAIVVCTAQSSFAGRPLSVDDANVNEVGAGHVEMWYARQPANTNLWTVAPAYGIAQGIEIGVAVARDATNDSSSNSVQAKFQITPSRKDGCNAAATLGASQANNGLENTPFVNGIVTCNTELGSLHANIGSNSPPKGPSLGTWGIALEREFGEFTAHAESFGQEQGSPTFQLGLRTQLAKNIQIDGTAGRVNGESVLSLGLKFQF